MAPSVEFLGHLLDAQGLRPLPERIRAVQEAPRPTNVSELKAYLGLISFYGKFLSNLSTHLASLYQLLIKDVPWKWTHMQEDAFQKFKKMLLSAKLLTHYNSQLPNVLACDATAYGIVTNEMFRWPSKTLSSRSSLNEVSCTARGGTSTRGH